MRFSHEVVIEDVDEALRLMYMSKDTLADSASRQSSRAAVNHVSEIYRLIVGLRNNKGQVRMSEAESLAKQRGFKPDQLQQCLEEYGDNNVWQVTKDSILFLH